MRVQAGNLMVQEDYSSRRVRIELEDDNYIVLDLDDAEDLARGILAVAQSMRNRY